MDMPIWQYALTLSITENSMEVSVMLCLGVMDVTISCHLCAWIRMRLTKKGTTCYEEPVVSDDDKDTCKYSIFSKRNFCDCE